MRLRQVQIHPMMVRQEDDPFPSLPRLPTHRGEPLQLHLIQVAILVCEVSREVGRIEPHDDPFSIVQREIAESLLRRKLGVAQRDVKIARAS